MGSVIPVERCFCVRCEAAKGNRTEEKFKEVNIPDYTILYTWPFWKKMLHQYYMECNIPIQFF